MKKIYTLVLGLAAVFSSLFAKADEGMWIPALLTDNYAEMQRLGLKMTPEQIYSINNNSMKDAIVRLGSGFCTGEIISNQGLILTNHHCGYSAIQKLSTTTANHLKNGFWAKNHSEEKSAGFSVSFLVKIEDITDKVLEGVAEDALGEARGSVIAKNSSAIKKELANDGAYSVDIKEMFSGNKYFAYVYEVFGDVRLVGTPPESVGKYGGDTDNWMWPRHTGDFSMFRVYADKDNKATKDYAEDNIPYTPKHHLPVSMKGVEKGDFAMIWGFPGSTDRYLTSYGVQDAVSVEQPARVLIRRTKLDIMEIGMNKEQKVRIQYASKHASTSNYWKYFVGQSAQLVKNNVYDKKKAIEDAYVKWANADKKRAAKYGNAITLIEEAYKKNNQYTLPNVYFEEAIFQGPDVFSFVMGNLGFRSEMKGALASEDEGKIKAAKKGIKEAAPAYFKDYNQEIDENLLASMLEMFYTNVDAAYHPATLTEIKTKYKGDFKAFAKKYYSKSPFASEEKLNIWLDKFSKKTVEKDPIYNLMNEFIDIYIQQIIMPQQLSAESLAKGMRLFVDGTIQMNKDKAYASDANSTMRVTYGNVLAYDGADAIHYSHITTLEGVMQKEVVTDNQNHEFYVPKKLKDLYLVGLSKSTTVLVVHQLLFFLIQIQLDKYKH